MIRPIAFSALLLALASGCKHTSISMKTGAEQTIDHKNNPVKLSVSLELKKEFK